MLFLIDYDRRQGKVISLRKFEASQRRSADEARLQLELELNRNGIEREVVLLEAETEAAIRQTHRRYFEDMRTLVISPALDGNGSPGTK